MTSLVKSRPTHQIPEINPHKHIGIINQMHQHPGAARGLVTSTKTKVELFLLFVVYIHRHIKV